MEKPWVLLIIGAGKSAGYAIEYWAEHAAQHGAEVWVVDRDFEHLFQGFGRHSAVRYVQGDASDATFLVPILGSCKWALSLLPATMHAKVAEHCVRLKVHLATASYESAEMRALANQIEGSGLFFLNEMGLDPGIDHASALALLDEVRQRGERVQSFESHCGGLVRLADCQGNPWQYKFTWNPMNVVRAGQGGDSLWREAGQLQRRGPQQVFEEIRPLVLEDGTWLEAYPNRDSLAYVDAYGLQEADRVLRGTLRRPGFCAAWNRLVQWGWVSDVESWPAHVQTYGQAFALSTGFAQLADLGLDAETQSRLAVLGLDDGQRLLPSRIPAECLLSALMPVWALGPEDHDEVIMVHQLETHSHRYLSSLVLQGESSARTAMAKTVGLTLAMAVEIAVSEAGLAPGLHRPMSAWWYSRLLPKWKAMGIEFKHSCIPLPA